MDMVSVAGIGIISAVLCVIVRQYKPELAVGVSLACGVVILGAALALLQPSIEALSQLAAAAQIDSSLCAVLIKALAVCYLTQIAADTCRDAGESAVAAKVELAGRAAVLAVSLPVFAALAELITDLLQ